MHAVKVHIEIPEDRTVSLPNTVPTGPAEIIVLTEQTTPPHGNRQALFGCAKGKIRMSDDFDDPLPEFEEYMK